MANPGWRVLVGGLVGWLAVGSGASLGADLELVGSLGGSCRSLALSGDTIYLQEGQHLTVLDACSWCKASSPI